MENENLGEMTEINPALSAQTGGFAFRDRKSVV